MIKICFLGVKISFIKRFQPMIFVLTRSFNCQNLFEIRICWVSPSRFSNSPARVNLSILHFEVLVSNVKSCFLYFLIEIWHNWNRFYVMINFWKRKIVICSDGTKIFQRIDHVGVLPCFFLIRFWLVFFDFFKVVIIVVRFYVGYFISSNWFRFFKIFVWWLVVDV